MPEIETRKEITKGTDSGKARFWLDEIARAGKREADWRKEGKDVVERYRGEKKRKRGFNILWSNTELLKPATLSRRPRADVRRRFLDEDPVAKTAADVLERSLNFVADDPAYDFFEVLKQVRDDMLLPGRGVPWVVYERDIRRREMERVEFTTEDQFTDDGLLVAPGQSDVRFELDGEEFEPDEIDGEDRAFRDELVSQDVYCEYVYWEDYREGDARVWEQVPWIARAHLFSREELVEQFGKVGHEVTLPIGGKTDGETTTSDDPDHALKRARVWEVWDKSERKRIWVAEGFHTDLLDEEDDPYNLENFWPAPDPVYSIRTTDTRKPVPEFRIYRDQADELDDVSMRIGMLIKALKVRGLYAGEFKQAFQDLFVGEENELSALEDWAGMQDIGGLEKAIAWLPIEQVAKVLAGLYNQRNQLKQEIFELTGLSDIIRGSTDPRETKGAQTLKANFGTVRLTPRQEPMERTVRDIFRIKAEIMAEHFTVKQFERMTGLNIEPQLMDAVIELLRDDKLRAFNVDIETDTTVQPDEQKEQANVVEFLKVSTEFMAAATQAAATSPHLVPLFFEMYKTAARRFKMGRELEDIIEETSERVVKALAEAQQQPPEPDPDTVKAQADIHADQAKAQSDQAIDVAKFQAEQQRENAALRADLERMEAELLAKIALKEAEMRGQQDIAAIEALNEARTVQ